MGGEPDQAIDEDVACQKCGYNLRTLAVTARCPECAFPALRSFVAHSAGARSFAQLDSTRLVRSAFVILSRLLRRNVDSIRFVFTVYQHAQHQVLNDRTRFLRDPEIHPADLCRALRDYALEHYGSRNDALATFRFWRLERSEDVGEIVAGLVEAGLMVPGERDSPADFVGHCDFIDALSRP